MYVVDIYIYINQKPGVELTFSMTKWPLFHLNPHPCGLKPKTEGWEMKGGLFFGPRPDEHPHMIISSGYLIL